MGRLFVLVSVEIADAEGAKITTIEGLNGGQGGHPVQQAWLELQVPQCGYCQSGQMMNAAAFSSCKSITPQTAKL